MRSSAGLLAGLSWCSYFPAGRKSITRFSVPSAIPVIPFLISGYGRFPPCPAQSFHQLPESPSPFSPHLPLKMETHFLAGFSSCLTGKRAPSVWRLLALLANDPAVEGRRWAARFPVKVGPARNLCQCCECVMRVCVPRTLL